MARFSIAASLLYRCAPIAMSKLTSGVPSDIIAARDAAECLFDAAAVERAVDQLAVRLTLRLHDAHPIVMCVMNGGMILTAELLLRLHFPLEVSYVHATRYRDATRAPCSSGAPRRPRWPGEPCCSWTMCSMKVNAGRGRCAVA